jgi:hypothetical protein
VFEVVNNSIEALPANPTGQLRGKGQDKNWNYCPSLNHITTFCPQCKLSKILK